MRAFLTAVLVLAAIGTGAAFVLRDNARSASQAFATSGVRLDPILVANNVGRMPPHAEHR